MTTLSNVFWYVRYTTPPAGKATTFYSGTASSWPIVLKRERSSMALEWDVDQIYIRQGLEKPQRDSIDANEPKSDMPGYAL